ncbi:MAG: class I tRNA ligase family protein, partial [Minisyncoccota bacterium]
RVSSSGQGWFERNILGGESFQEVGRRIGEFLYEIESKYKDKNILIITHGGVAWLAHVVAGLYEPENNPYHKPNTRAYIEKFKRYANAEVRELPFVPLPHDENFRVDLHRPYIDDFVLVKDDKEYKRTKEVMDVWLDSGSMPFASFDSNDVEDAPYPADFISEAIDQTRGWFYTLHAVGVLMGKGNAYKNVICLGHILDNEGKKMSKSLGNIVEPFQAIEKYGADTLRLWMYSVNQPGEPKNFDERSVDEVNKRIFNLLDNVMAFYELYRDKNLESKKFPSSKHVLDKWILEKLRVLEDDMTKNIESYKLLEPVRAIRGFIEDLSTWYLRRSRDRLKSGDVQAKQTLYYTLKTLSKLLAPFAPFASEELYQKLRVEDDEESVHLADWPEEKKGIFGMFVDRKGVSILNNMSEVRRVVSLALEARSKANIKIRQPLLKLEVRDMDLGTEFVELIKDEINVKEVIRNSKAGQEVILDTNITPELEEEGRVREIVRAVQEVRKEKKLHPNEKMEYEIPKDDEAFYKKHSKVIESQTNTNLISQL